MAVKDYPGLANADGEFRNEKSAIANPKSKTSLPPEAGFPIT